MNKLIIKEIKDSVSLKSEILASDSLVHLIELSAKLCISALQAGNKIILLGNGGSAADSQHIAAELVGRYLVDRPSLPALALTTDTSALTAIGNDYGFEDVFVRQIQGLGNTGDVLIAISTSGNSENVVKAAKEAQKMKIGVISLTGSDGGRLKNYSDIKIAIPSQSTPRIQETHILVGHIICYLIEKNTFT